MTERKISIAVFFLLLLIGVGLYSNSSRHEFALDDDHSIVRNPSVRSLENVPSYFTQPRTFSVLLTNIDYRPVLQTTYALNHAVAEYRMPIWHWTQVAIHIWCAMALFCFTRLLLEKVEGERKRAILVAALVSLAFLVHPVNSGVVNYVSARSSSLTAAFLLTAFCLELSDRQKIAWVMMLLALFTKVEAVAALAVFWGISVLRSNDPWPGRLKGNPRRWMPYAGAVVIYMVARQFAMQGIDFAGFAGASGVTRWMYLCTQTTVWWTYLLHWFCPFNLVADNSVYPIYRGLLDPPVMMACLGLGVAILALWCAAKKRPHFPLLALSYLALLSPTSSVVPLAEMVNEHRPYLPVALLSLVFVTAIVNLGERLPKPGRVALALLAVGWLGCLSVTTWQRNRVFDNASTYWADVLDKAPSARAYNNFGLILMKEGKMDEARRHFEESVRLAPGYCIAHINLAIALHNTGSLPQARQHYDLAVQYDRGDGNAQLWRARFFLKTEEYDKARDDFLTAEKLTNDYYSIHAGLAQSYAGLGEPEKSADRAAKAAEIDFTRFGFDIVSIAQPYFASNDRTEDGVTFFDRLLVRWPNVAWLHGNRSALLRRLGRIAEAEAAEKASKEAAGE